MFLEGPHCRRLNKRNRNADDHYTDFWCAVITTLPVYCCNDVSGTLQLGTCTYFVLFVGRGHTSNLFKEIKTLWWYYWGIVFVFLELYFFLLVLAMSIVCIIIIIIMAQLCAAKFVQIISNTSASSSKLICHCPSITAFWRSGLKSLNCLCSMWKAYLLTLFL